MFLETGSFIAKFIRNGFRHEGIAEKQTHSRYALFLLNKLSTMNGFILFNIHSIKCARTVITSKCLAVIFSIDVKELD